MKKIKWPLCADVFTFWDKVKISWFLFTERMWTYGTWIRKYEQLWEREFGCKHAIMVSSGSTANELIALRRKWELQQTGEWPARNKVIFPVNTWISSVSPWVNIGFEPVFIDISDENLNLTPEHILSAFEKDRTIGTVFYTALLGFFNDLEACKSITEQYGAKFLMDNCEASFSYYATRFDSSCEGKSILSIATCSTSVFYSHFTTSGTEGGLIFTQSDDEADWFRMARSHGMTRGMPEKYRNLDVSPEFDFYMLGSNYRSSNLQAYMAILDFYRALEFGFSRRRLIMNSLIENLDKSKYPIFSCKNDYFSLSDHALSIPLAIPLLFKKREQKDKAVEYLKSVGVMTRPIVGGCLLAHTAFKGYGKIDDFPVAKWSHECGIYIGLNQNITIKMAKQLANELNLL